MTKSTIWYIISGIITCVLVAMEYYVGYYLEMKKAIEEHKKLGFYSDAFAQIQSISITGGIILLTIVTIPLLYCIWQMPQDMIEMTPDQ